MGEIIVRARRPAIDARRRLATAARRGDTTQALAGGQAGSGIAPGPREESRPMKDCRIGVAAARDAGAAAGAEGAGSPLNPRAIF